MSEQFTSEQIKWAITEIAGNAYSALELCSEAIANPDSDTQAAVLTGRDPQRAVHPRAEQ